LITVVTSLFGLMVAGFLLHLMRKDHLHVSHGVGWSIAIALSAFLAQTLGVSYAPILGVSIAIAALLIKALLSDIESTRLKVKQQRLIQRIALLEADLSELTGKNDVDD
jgi:membrane protein implicated in regulation of membrane protease activity